MVRSLRPIGVSGTKDPESPASPPPCETHRGTIFIVGFRSRRSHGDEDRRHRSLEGQVDGPHAAKESVRMGPPLLALVAPFASILLPEASS